MALTITLISGRRRQAQEPLAPLPAPTPDLGPLGSLSQPIHVKWHDASWRVALGKSPFWACFLITKMRTLITDLISFLSTGSQCT